LKKEGLVAILKAAGTNLTLKQLNISYNKAVKSLEVIKQLESLLTTNSTLEVLKAAGIALGRHMGAMFQPLVNHKHLSHLDISKNNIGNQVILKIFY
jgi:hypothetical protein